MTDAVQGDVPRHVAIIMDGNGRWARQRGLARIKGHERGAESIRAVLRACREFGVKYLTLYAISIENWIRPKPEVKALMNLLVRFLRQEAKELHDNKIRLRTIGRTEDLPKQVRKELLKVIDETSGYTGQHLTLALSYGGRMEIAQAARQLAELVKSGKLEPEQIDENAVAAQLYEPELPDPDLLIRTSGEMRVSNFLLWQISYAELYVTDVLWPDFGEKEFAGAIEDYRSRDRRFGGHE